MADPPSLDGQRIQRNCFEVRLKQKRIEIKDLVKQIDAAILEFMKAERKHGKS